MKTDDLIKLLTQDAAVSFRLAPSMAAALVGSVCVSAAVLLLTIGIRPDFADAIYAGRVVFKLGITLLAAVIAANLVFRIGRPGADLGLPKLLLFVPPVLVVAAVVAELFAIPASSWKASMMGRNSAVCLIFIPLLSLAPLLGSFIVLRRTAPQHPGLAGAVAGLMSGCIAASLYAWRCPDDSPLFLAVWYTVSILGVSAAGYLIGGRVLKW